MGMFNNKKKAKKAMNEARDLENEMYANQIGMQQPYYDLGQEMTKQYQDWFKGGGHLFDPNSVTMDPGYAFREKQGMQGIENSAMARGGLMSGNTIKATQDYGQDLASQEYGNAYNRAWSQYGDKRGMMQNMLGYGEGQMNIMRDLKNQQYGGKIGQKMQDAEKYAGKSKGMGKMLGNTALGFATGGLGGGLGALGGGMLGGMF